MDSTVSEEVGEAYVKPKAIELQVFSWELSEIQLEGIKQYWM